MISGADMMSGHTAHDGAGGKAMGFIREVIDAFRGVETLALTETSHRTVDRRKPVDPLAPVVLPEGVLKDRRGGPPVFGKAGTRPDQRLP